MKLYDSIDLIIHFNGMGLFDQHENHRYSAYFYSCKKHCKLEIQIIERNLQIDGCAILKTVTKFCVLSRQMDIFMEDILSIHFAYLLEQDLLVAYFRLCYV